MITTDDNTESLKFAKRVQLKCFQKNLKRKYKMLHFAFIAKII